MWWVWAPEVHSHPKGQNLVLLGWSSLDSLLVAIEYLCSALIRFCTIFQLLPLLFSFAVNSLLNSLLILSSDSCCQFSLEHSLSIFSWSLGSIFQSIDRRRHSCNLDYMCFFHCGFNNQNFLMTLHQYLLLGGRWVQQVLSWRRKRRANGRSWLPLSCLHSLLWTWVCSNGGHLFMTLRYLLHLVMPMGLLVKGLISNCV